ncbi:MAG TPA: PHP domain-containing protein, partial [Anaerolineales bacterium]|nr:PHP domain-containing protein [Anaerolineales bacterium]
HLHSYYSDGCISPAGLLHAAAEDGLKTVALTDHDTLAGLEEAGHVADKLGLELISGVELTCSWFGTDSPQIVDLMGYFFDPANPALLAACQEGLVDLEKRMLLACKYLGELGMQLSYFDLQEQNPRYAGAGQLIAALVQSGQVLDWLASYHMFSRVWPRLPLPKLSLENAIDQLHAAGGVAVLAHPVAVRGHNGWLQAVELAPLVAAGLDGLETEHPRLDHAAKEHFRGLAARFNLALSGGSDEHGWNGGVTRLGSELVTYDMVHELHNRAAGTRSEPAG